MLLEEAGVVAGAGAGDEEEVLLRRKVERILFLHHESQTCRASPSRFSLAETSVPSVFITALQRPHHPGP